MSERERFEYQGYQAMHPSRLQPLGSSKRILFIEVEAIIPYFDEPPLLDRVEWEEVSSAYGWEEVGGGYALAGWRKRLSELAAGFNMVYVFFNREEYHKAELIAQSLALSPLRGRYGTWPLRDWGYGQPYDYYVESFAECLTAHMRHRLKISELVIYLNKDQLFAEDVASALSYRRERTPITVRTVHPQLGLLATRMPMPPGFEEIDDWLEQVAPIPGTFKSDTQNDKQ